MQTSSPVDIFIVYRILRLLVTPFTDFEAFKLGIIDQNGTTLKQFKDLHTSDERNAFSIFIRFILNMKKIINSLPGGKSTLKNYVAALYLVREQNNSALEDIDLMREDFVKFLNHPEYLQLNEDAPTVAAGNGQVAGIGVGKDGEPGIEPNNKKKHPMLRRSKFAGNDVFTVESERYSKVKYSKLRYHRWEHTIGNDDIGNAIKEYAQANPHNGIILQDEKTGHMAFVRYGKNR
jgi:hypothetical protein